ncbi:sensor domain-containing diguanylate cyclase [Roseomonas sp. HF4]|uniref:sensor domain-containing diguanylate cyclase n=1 Tax=Roseomonas sp. HF4 TaxID=2562313 RepID=UPI0014854399|nr:sensor domain-containing diguanylate cyclase [Roseomonas sp. HF4]
MTTALRPEDRTVTVPPAAAAAGALHGALLESRQRWQDLAGLGADMVFETDTAGRFTFLWPATVLGHRADALLGRRADSLLLGAGANPFALRQAVRGQRAWVADAARRPRCLSLSLVPLGDARGGFVGLRGAAHDVTEQETAATAAAAGLRRAALLDALGEKVRHAATAHDAAMEGLAALREALGCAGTGLLVPDGPGASVALATADPPPGLLAEAGAAIAADRDWAGRLAGGVPAALLPHQGRHPACAVLAAWREAQARDWDAEDLAVLRATAPMLGAVLGFHRLQQELERQAGTDPLTGLVNRRAFLAALQARTEGTGTARQGALVFLDLDNLKPLNDLQGHEAGDAALRATALLLRRTAAEGDFAGRFGGDEFVLWIEGADAAGATARAEALLGGAAALPPAGAPRFSLGIALWTAASGEGAARLMARADDALYAAKRGARGGWRVAEDTA